MTNVGEQINVIASFGYSNKIKPLRFHWSGRLHDVKEITYTWKTKEGQSEIYHFSLTDGKTLYELSFDADSLVWRVERVEG